MNNRILLKISGESLSDQHQFVNQKKIDALIEQIKDLHKKYQIAIVIGGGNIWRGAKNTQLDISRNVSDVVGMLATCINATILCDSLNKNNIKAKIYSNHDGFNMISKINYVEIDQALNNHEVIIFSAGTNNPYFSTDSGAALRAGEIHADWIIMAKNGVDGVYDQDPKLNPNAKFYDHLTYDDVITKQLNVMDLTALSICKENHIKIKVFNADAKQGFIKAINNEIKLTIIEEK